MPQQLNDYLRQVQRFIRDGGQQLVDVADLIDYINRARRELAGRTQCVRIVGPIGAGLSTIQVSAGGVGYKSTDTLVISAPDSPSGAAPWPSGRQATGGFTVNPITGAITSVNLIDGGDGYFQPTASISSATGSGSTLVCTTPQISATITNQEVYQFSAQNLEYFPGVKSIIAIKSIAIIYANYRYVLPYYPFTIYQAMIRQYPRQYYYVPTMWSQFGQGANGSAYLYPIASQAYQQEWDSICLPSDLVTNQDVEVIPDPWCDAVPYFAAHLAFMELQNLNAAKFYLDLYDNMVHRYSAYARPGRASNVYGRYVLPFLIAGGTAAATILGSGLAGLIT